VKTLIALFAVLLAPCITLGANPFCKVQRVQKLDVKQIVGYPVHQNYGHYTPQFYYQPIGQYATYKTPDELTAAALDRLNLTIRESQGLPANALAQTDISAILQKCANCHAAGKQHEGEWLYDPSAPLDAQLAKYVGRGLNKFGMSDKAKLTDDEQGALLDWYESTMFDYVPEGE
jgi:mono/diheme cytochrome c family protein